MVKFRNRLTGSIMWVTDDRVDEYKKLGHKVVDETISEKPAVFQFRMLTSASTKRLSLQGKS